jgi:hypothetical protein
LRLVLRRFDVAAVFAGVAKHFQLPFAKSVMAHIRPTIRRFRDQRGFRVALLGWVIALVFVFNALAQFPGSAKPAGANDRPSSEFDLQTLADQIRASRAIGFFTKLSLRNQVDDLVEAFRRYHDGESEKPLDQLRERYFFLLMKIISLLQDREPDLSKEIFDAREVLWAKLADPKKFSKL